jgi:hypothetical protein
VEARSVNTKSLPIGKLALEAFAIFLGVTAGFLAEDYREYRNEREREREVLEQIVRDLNLDAEDITPIVERSRAVAAAATWLHNNVRRSDVPLDSVVLVLNAMPAVYSYEAANAAYAGLKGAGDLDLIRDADLLNELFYYFEDRQAAMEALNEWILEGDTRFWDRVAPYVVFDTASSLVERPPILRLDLRAMQADPAMGPEFYWNGSVNEGQASDGQAILDLNARLAERVTRALNGG